VFAFVSIFPRILAVLTRLAGTKTVAAGLATPVVTPSFTAFIQPARDPTRPGVPLHCLDDTGTGGEWRENNVSGEVIVDIKSGEVVVCGSSPKLAGKS
jgi:hypothetical protein